MIPRENKKNNYRKKAAILAALIFIFVLASGYFYAGRLKSKTFFDLSLPETYDQPLKIKFAGHDFIISPLGEVAAAKAVTDENNPNIIKYLDAFKNTDIVETKYANKLKEDIILKTPGHPAEFSYKIDVSNYDFVKNRQGDITFYPKGKKGDELYKIFTLPAPFMVDAKGKKSLISDVPAELTEAGILTVSPSKAWLAQAAYPVNLDPTIAVNVLNVYSHPGQGDNWIVDFITEGTADLKIIPDDQATIDDDEFVSLACGAEVREPQILAGDIIFYPDWSCNATAQVIHYTKKAGSHTLRFEFGGEIDYAHNGAFAIRQEINIIDGYIGAASGAFATSSEIVQLDTTKYTNPAYYFEVVASTSASLATQVFLRRTDGVGFATTTIPAGTTSYTLLRSPAFTPPAGANDFVAVIASTTGATKGIIAARIIILQNNTALANTETQIEIGSRVIATSSIVTTPLDNPKYWHYDSNSWDGTLTFYAEVTYRNYQISSSTTYNVSATTTTTYADYIASAGVSYVQIQAWGAGGAGGNGNSGGGGGGGGAYALATTSVIAGSINKLGIGGGAVRGSVGVAASSTYIGADGYIVRAAGGTSGGNGVLGAGGVDTSPATIGNVVYAGGNGGNGYGTLDLGGGGGGAGGPDGPGVSAVNASANTPTPGGNGDNNSGGAGGLAGTTNDDVCATAQGEPGVSHPKGAGGGGGAGGDGGSVCPGGSGGSPGGGGGGSDGGASEQTGGPGQIVLTETLGRVGIALEKDNGAFGGWTFVQQIVAGGVATSSPDRVRVTFTPETGKNYRLVASTTNETASYDIYNAKIIVDQASIDSVTSYYFNASYTAATDSSAYWTNDGLAFDSDATPSTYASQAGDVSGKTSTKDSNYLMAEGTNAPGEGNTITQVRARINGGGYTPVDSGRTINATIYTNGAAEELGTVTATASTNGIVWGSYVTLSAPSLGWTWTKLQELQVRCYGAGEGIGVGIYAAKIEIEVTLSAGANPSRLEPQYLLANTLVNSTGLANFDTSWNPAEWAGVTNTYLHQIDSATADDSAKLQTNPNGGPAEDITGSTATIVTGKNIATSTTMAMPATATTTDVNVLNAPIYASRILVRVVVNADTPITPSHTGQTADSMAWNWVSGGAQTGYEYGSTSPPAVGTTTDLFWNESGLSANTSYTRYVRAYNAGSPPGYSSVLTIGPFYTSANTPITAGHTNQSTSTLRLTWASGGRETDYAYGTTNTCSDGTTSNTYLDFSSLSPNTQQTRYVCARNGDGDKTPDLLLQFYTSASTSSLPTVNNPTTTTLDVNLVSGGAEDSMEIYVETGATCDGPDSDPGDLGYVQADGSIHASNQVWQADGTWGTGGTITVTMPSEGTQYAFCVRAKNGDGDMTGWGTASTGTTLTSGPSIPNTPGHANQASTSTQWTWASGGTQDGYTYGDTSDCSIGTTTNLYWDESSLSANVEYTRYVKAYLSAGPTYSSPVTIGPYYTSASTSTAPIVDAPTTTTLNVNPVSGGAEASMEIYAEAGAACDGSGGLGYVQANGTIHASNEVWQADGAWSTITVNGLEINTQYAFCVRTKNGDGDLTGWGAAAALSTSSTDPPANGQKFKSQGFFNFKGIFNFR